MTIISRVGYVGEMVSSICAENRHKQQRIDTAKRFPGKPGSEMPTFGFSSYDAYKEATPLSKQRRDALRATAIGVCGVAAAALFYSIATESPGTHAAPHSEHSIVVEDNSDFALQAMMSTPQAVNVRPF